MQSRNYPIRIGLIGAGRMGHLRARAIGRLWQLRLVAVADHRIEIARHLAQGQGVDACYDDGEALAADPNVDAVIVSTPPAAHEYGVLAALRARRDVLCEKPLGTALEACGHMIEAAEEAGVTLATGFNLRYTPAAQLAKRLIAAGGIGRLDHIRAYHGHPGGTALAQDWFTDKQSSGGGSLMENGIHLIDLTRYFLGEVQACKGFATNYIWQKSGCEDNGFLLMKNAQGHIASLQSSWTEWRGYGYRMEIYGTDGYIRFGYPPLWLEHARRTSSGRNRTRRYNFPGQRFMERLHGQDWGMVRTLMEDLRQWAAALHEGRQPPVTGRDGAEAVRLAQSAEFCSFSA